MNTELLVEKNPKVREEKDSDFSFNISLIDLVDSQLANITRRIQMKVAIISTIIEIAEIDETNMPGETEGEKLQNLKEEAQSDLHNMIEDEKQFLKFLVLCINFLHETLRSRTAAGTTSYCLWRSQSREV